jgi:hypothetical protein
MSIKYPLHDLTWQGFEDLVVLICDRVLGMGTIKFSSGKDGGRDAKFSGKAQRFPSTAAPWDGKFIIQAKHTENPLAKCSESAFKDILGKEVSTRLPKLIASGEAEHYLVFTNRKLSGLAEPKITDLISTSLKIKSCVLGVERIHLYLQEFPDIAKIAKLNDLLLPFQFYEQDLVEVIKHFSQQKDTLKKKIGAVRGIKWIDKEEKNRINRLSSDYFDFIKKESLPYFLQIDKFLKSGKNKKFRDFYDDTVADLQEQILIKRSDYGMFEEVLRVAYNHVIDNGHPDVVQRRRLIRVFLHYMYFNCDIGLLESDVKSG